jgi:hypothetical protein
VEKRKQLKLRSIMPWCLVALFGRAEAGTQNFTLYISPGTWPINGAGGAIVNVWGYGEQS